MKKMLTVEVVTKLFKVIDLLVAELQGVSGAEAERDNLLEVIGRIVEDL